MIQNPNSCGQGFDADYVNVPMRDVIEAFGFRYSHSTNIKGAAIVDYVSHTFERGERRISLDRLPRHVRWASKTSCASGTSRGGYTLQSLARHLVRITPVGETM